jgi:hypothetical protein
MTSETERIITNEHNNQRVTQEDIDLIIETMKKEAPYDEVSLRQILYGCFSAFTRTPLHHNVNSRRSGAGKTYDLTLTSGYFPDKFVLSFIGMSDKALMHEQGTRVMIDEETGNTIPIESIINEKQTQINELENKLEDAKVKESHKTFRNKINELKNEIKELNRKSEKLIELTNRIVLMLDTPQEGLYSTLMSLVSQDTTKDQLYQFAEKNSSGKMGSPRNRLRGTPAMFTTQVIDDTRQVRYQEKNRRFIHVTPNTSTRKVSAARSLIGKKFGLLPDEYNDQVVDAGDKQRVKDTINTIVERLIDHSKLLKPKESGIKIPFAEAIANGIGGDETEWSMTVMDRLVKYLSTITKVNMDSRPRIEDIETGKFYPISTFADLKEALELMQIAASTLRPYLADWHNRVFLPYFKELEGPNKLYDKFGNVVDSEQYKGLSTEQLANRTFDVMKVKTDRRSIREQYLYPLSNTGIINIVKSSINRNELISYPVEEGNIFSIFSNDKDLRLEIPPELYPSRSVIEDSFRTLVKQEDKEGVEKNQKFDKYRLLDHEGNEIAVQELIGIYLTDPWTCFRNKERDQEAKARNLCMIGYYPMRDELNNFSPPGCPPVLTRIQNNVIEESSSSEVAKTERFEEESEYQEFLKENNEWKMGFHKSWSIRKLYGDTWKCYHSSACSKPRGNDKWSIYSHAIIHQIQEVKEQLGILKEFDLDTQKEMLRELDMRQLNLLAAQCEHGTQLEKQILLARDYLLDAGRM